MKSCQKKDIVKYHLRYEHDIYLGFGVILALIWFVYVVPLAPLGITIRWALISIAFIVFIWMVCGSYPSLYYSHVGRELRKYGDLREMVRDVREQYEMALYRTIDQAITEKYLMLSVDNEKYLLGRRRFFHKQMIFCLVSTSEISKIRIEEDSPYADKMNTMIFTTCGGKIYRCTVHRSYEEVWEIKQELERCIVQGKGVPQHLHGQVAQKEKNTFRKRGKSRRAMASYHTVSSCCANRKKIFWGIVTAIVVVLAAGIYYVAKLADYMPIDFVNDIVKEPVLFSILAAVYIVPISIVYIHIRRMENQVMKCYHRLKYYEQRALDQRIKESKEQQTGDVIYEPSCFWFCDWHNAFFHNLICYDDVVWIYQARAVLDFQSVSAASGVTYWHSIVFYTKDGKKHSIFAGNWNLFSSHFPNAIVGYGKEQKKAYRNRKLTGTVNHK